MSSQNGFKPGDQPTIGPPHFSLKNAIRPNLWTFLAFTSPTFDEGGPRPETLLDANEGLNSCLNISSDASNPTPLDHAIAQIPELASLHRYPSATQVQLKQYLVEWRSLGGPRWVCLGLGSSDFIDIIIHSTCTATRRDAILITPPTFLLYKSRALLNEVEVVEVPLDSTDGLFTLDLEKVLRELAHNPQIRVIFLASPGNPTGRLLPITDIKRILDFPAFKGILVVDEAYIDYCSSPATVTVLPMLQEYSNLIVLQTLSKSHGLAGLRLGMAFAQPALIEILEKVRMPFNICTPTSVLALRALSPSHRKDYQKLIQETIINRQNLLKTITSAKFEELGVGRPIGGTDSNSVLLPIFQSNGGVDRIRDDSRALLIAQRLKSEHSVGVRYCGNEVDCEACLRITVGTEAELEKFLDSFDKVLREC